MTINQESFNGMMNCILSDDLKYRYFLSRSFGGPGLNDKTITFIMLNPSTADAFNDDPTVRKCIHYARRQQMDRLIIVNVYAFRSTDPKLLPEDEEEARGPQNGQFLDDAISQAHVVVCAWGRNIRPESKHYVAGRSQRAPQYLCLGTNKDGSPKHPLYLKNDAPLVEWIP